MGQNITVLSANCRVLRNKTTDPRSSNKAGRNARRAGGSGVDKATLEATRAEGAERRGSNF